MSRQAWSCLVRQHSLRRAKRIHTMYIKCRTRSDHPVIGHCRSHMNALMRSATRLQGIKPVWFQQWTHWAKKRNNWVNITKSDSLRVHNLEVGIEGFFSVTNSQKIPLILRN